MSTELTHRTAPEGTALTLNDKMQYAEAMAQASLLPRAYQRQPGNVLLAMEFGDALGIPAIQAINDIHVIEGKPTASANLIGALVRKAGHKLRVFGDDQQATAQVIRADDPDFTFEVTWTVQRAQQAGLVRKGGNWEKYPAAMLKARAITEVARAACPDALYGVIYTPEELGAVVTEDGDPVASPNPAPRPQAAPQRAPRPTLGEAVQNAAPSAPDWRPTWERVKQVLMEAGVTGSERDLLAAAASLADKRMTHPQELTEEDVARIEAECAQPATETTTVEAEVIDDTTHNAQEG